METIPGDPEDILAGCPTLLHATLDAHSPAYLRDKALVLSSLSLEMVCLAPQYCVTCFLSARC